MHGRAAVDWQQINEARMDFTIEDDLDFITSPDRRLPKAKEPAHPRLSIVSRVARTTI
jgi:hypothetical protein